MTFASGILYGNRHSYYIFTLVIMALGTQQGLVADSLNPMIDDRCDHERTMVEFEDRVLGPCRDSADICVEERMTRLAESRDQAREFCWQRTLNIDSRFLGRCPQYMEILESEEYARHEWILPRVMLRFRFHSRDEDGAILESFKQDDSIQSLRELLVDDPNNPVALVHLSLLLEDHDVVEKLNLYLKLHELDSDCADDYWLRKRQIYSRVSTLTDNWLAKHGPGSEMPTRERKELLLRVQHTLLNMYDTGVAQDHMTNRLYWALESIHDPILSGSNKDIERIATSLSIDLKDYAVERRTELVNNLTQAYDIESVHGRAETLVMMWVVAKFFCNFI